MYTAQLEQIAATRSLLWVCEWTPRTRSAALKLHIMNAPHLSATSIASFIIISRPPATAFSTCSSPVMTRPQICAAKDFVHDVSFFLQLWFQCAYCPCALLCSLAMIMSYYTAYHNYNRSHPGKNIIILTNNSIQPFISRSYIQHRMELW